MLRGDTLATVKADAERLAATLLASGAAAETVAVAERMRDTLAAAVARETTHRERQRRLLDLSADADDDTNF